MGRILVIDDSVTVALAVRCALAADGHEVEAITSVTSLFRQLRERAPDVILLDLEMPGFSGLDFGGMIRAYERGRTQVIIHSSRPREDLLAAARIVGAVDVISKGSSLSELRRVVTRALDQARFERPSNSHVGTAQDASPVSKVR